MSDIAFARITVSLISIVPIAIGWFWAKYYDYFPRHSWKQIISTIIVVSVLLSLISFERNLYTAIGKVSRHDWFLQIILILQPACALTVLFRTAYVKEKQKNESSIFGNSQEHKN